MKNLFSFFLRNSTFLGALLPLVIIFLLIIFMFNNPLHIFGLSTITELNQAKNNTQIVVDVNKNNQAVLEQVLEEHKINTRIVTAVIIKKTAIKEKIEKRINVHQIKQSKNEISDDEKSLNNIKFLWNAYCDNEQCSNQQVEENTK